MVSKICCWDGGVCRLVSCDVILMDGSVVVCDRHRNPFGRFRRKRVCAPSKEVLMSR